MSRDLHVRVSDSTYVFLKGASDETGLTMAHLVRQAVVEKYQPWIADLDLAEPAAADRRAISAAVSATAAATFEEASIGERLTARLARLIDFAVAFVLRRLRRLTAS